jgi:hypothetical protein
VGGSSLEQKACLLKIPHLKSSVQGPRLEKAGGRYAYGLPARLSAERTIPLLRKRKHACAELSVQAVAQRRHDFSAIGRLIYNSCFANGVPHLGRNLDEALLFSHSGAGSLFASMMWCRERVR